MILEQNDVDLSLLSHNFTTCGDYTEEVILAELEYYQKLPNFVCIVSEDDNVINGFLIGYRNRNSLWIAQVWNKAGLSVGREALAMAEEWAKKRGMTSLTCETTRNEMKAMERYGLSEFSIIMRREI